ncbi:hypothetical protein IFR05_015408 [Cadophora sp. M221]|nr:hypothetical protein IFR05_015408 [Cadophora sp. M221]
MKALPIALACVDSSQWPNLYQSPLTVEDIQIILPQILLSAELCETSVNEDTTTDNEQYDTNNYNAEARKSKPKDLDEEDTKSDCDSVFSHCSSTLSTASVPDATMFLPAAPTTTYTLQDLKKTLRLVTHIFLSGQIHPLISRRD